MLNGAHGDSHARVGFAAPGTSPVCALCATMYAAISGVVPAVATDRVVGEADLDTFKTMDLAVPETVEAAITHGLAVKSADRPQSMAELYQELTGGGTPGVVEKPADPIPAVQRDWNKMKRVDDLPERPEPKKTGKVWMLVPLLLILAINNLPLSCPIVIGQELVIPAPDMEMPTATPIPLDQYTIGQQIEYTVEINDTYPGIAAKFNTTLDSIQRLNDIEDMSSFPTFGQTLIIAVNLVTPTPF